MNDDSAIWRASAGILPSRIMERLMTSFKSLAAAILIACAIPAAASVKVVKTNAINRLCYGYWDVVYKHSETIVDKEMALNRISMIIWGYTAEYADLLSAEEFAEFEHSVNVQLSNESRDHFMHWLMKFSDYGNREWVKTEADCSNHELAVRSELSDRMRKYGIDEPIQPVSKDGWIL